MILFACNERSNILLVITEAMCNIYVCLTKSVKILECWCTYVEQQIKHGDIFVTIHEPLQSNTYLT